jgi:TatD DNase family protein
MFCEMSRTKDPFEDNLVVPGTTDSHLHAEVCEEKGLEIAAILRYIRGKGFAELLDISVSPDSFEHRRELLDDHPFVYLAVGAHPSETEWIDLESLRGILGGQARAPRVIALGEIGLDWYWDFGTRDAQRDLFAAQLEIAGELGLPVVVHNRDAGEDVAELLESRAPRAGGIMHCFSEGTEIARRTLDLGFYIGFGGNVTYKKSERIREAARYAPRDRLLVETDAPFLAPQRVRGRPNHPGYLGHTVNFVAELRGVAPEELAHTTTVNFRRLFKLGGEA